MAFQSPYNLLLIFALIALLHEVGHFYCALRLRVQVSKFILGIGPRIFSRQFQVRGIPFSFSMHLLPLGGAIDVCDESFDRSPLTSKCWVLASGALVNLFTAILGLIILLGYCNVLGNSPTLAQLPQHLFIAIATTGRLVFDALFQTSTLTIQDQSNIRAAYQLLSINPELWFLALFVFFSLLSGFLNLLPLPGLDGGRLFSCLLEKLNFTSKSVAELIHRTGLKLLTWLALGYSVIWLSLRMT